MIKIQTTFSVAILVSVFFLAPIIVYNSTNVDAYTVSGTPETLIPDSAIHCDYHYSKSGGNLANAHTFVDGDPGASSVVFWETNDTYLYWGNATGTGDTTTDWGVGTGIFTLSDPSGTSDYWRVNVTFWVGPITFIPSTWTEIGGVTPTGSYEYYAGNLGVGYTSPGTSTIIHTQMHTTDYQDGYWSFGSESSRDNPPNAWDRPTTGVDWYQFDDNTLMNRPFTLEEVQNMIIVVKLNFDPLLFGVYTVTAGHSVSIGLAGLAVTVTPVSYTPPDYSDGFILRPDDDLNDSTDLHGETNTFRTQTYSTTDRFDSVNETTSSSDQDTTYLYANWTDQNDYLEYDDDHRLSNVWSEFSLTDPPEDAPQTANTEYLVYLWMIAKVNNQSYESVFVAKIFPINAPLQSYEMNISGIGESYSNYSFEYMPTYLSTGQVTGEYTGNPFAPFTGYPHYTYSELKDLVVGIYLFGNGMDFNPFNPLSGLYLPGSGYARVSQLAVICVPYSLHDGEFHDATTTENISLLVWLIIIFLPAIALGAFIPKLGFVAGMSLMLGVFGFAQPGFYQISVMGFIALAIALYKDR